jgi:hypothetical protein
MTASHFAMVIGLNLFCSLVLNPNHLVCLHHFGRGVPLNLAVTAASL